MEKKINPEEVVYKEIVQDRDGNKEVERNVIVSGFVGILPDGDHKGKMVLFYLEEEEQLKVKLKEYIQKKLVDNNQEALNILDCMVKYTLKMLK